VTGKGDFVMDERKRVKGGEGQAGHPALCVLPEIEKEDEILESIWTLKEEGKLTWDNILQSCQIDGCEDALRAGCRAAPEGRKQSAGTCAASSVVTQVIL
jgi:hypothetical protein